MPTWGVWLIVAGILGVVEVTTLTLVLGMLAGGAVAAAVGAGLGANAPVQVALFAGSSVLLLAAVRPVARRHLRTPVALRTGVAALIGRGAVVVEAVDDQHGLVKIGGEVWTARSYDETQTLPVGATVDVVRIDGATALVYRPEPP